MKASVKMEVQDAEDCHGQEEYTVFIHSKFLQNKRTSVSSGIHRELLIPEGTSYLGQQVATVSMAVPDLLSDEHAIV